MAFKKIDFSKLDTSAPRKAESPYEYTDKMHFARTFKGETTNTGIVTVGLDRRRLSIGIDDQSIPATVGDKRIELVLKGQRATDWDDTVHASLSAERTGILEAVEDLREADWDLADGVTTEVEVEGFWKKRFWKDRDGKWQHVLQLHVARFTHNGVEKGRLPEMA